MSKQSVLTFNLFGSTAVEFVTGSRQLAADFNLHTSGDMVQSKDYEAVEMLKSSMVSSDLAEYERKFIAAIVERQETLYGDPRDPAYPHKDWMNASVSLSG